MRGQITELMTMHTGAPDAWVWDADPPLVLAWNEERHLHLAAGGSFFEVVAEDANGPDAGSAAHGLLSQIASLQNVSSLRVVEVTFVWLLAGENRAPRSRRTRLAPATAIPARTMVATAVPLARDKESEPCLRGGGCVHVTGAGSPDGGESDMGRGVAHGRRDPRLQA
ncbi:MAG: hypothetical protein MSC31_12915 [Solirubrobacteraceae bacterium MAG38_C4-C5]|nr:hypothetical protein [Candidatus Siliceabacter maunaloa]